jgi:hypothetical protein
MPAIYPPCLLSEGSVLRFRLWLTHEIVDWPHRGPGADRWHDAQPDME